MSVPKTDPLGQQHAALRAQVKQTRRADTVAKTLGAILVEAVNEAAAMKAEGADPAIIAQALERVVRDHWPKGRAEEWHEVCAECGDYAWKQLTCPGDATCGRHRRHAAHDYAVPCWCDKGRALQPPAPSEQDFTQAGRSRKPARAPARFGQR